MPETFSFLAGAFAFIGSCIYSWGIIHGYTQPVKASSIIGKLFTISIFIGMWQKDALNGQIWISMLMAFVSTPLALLYGRPGWQPIDVICLTLGILGIFVWSFIPDPTIAIGVGLLVLGVGSSPTWASAWEDPKRENRISLLFGVASSLCAIAAIRQWDVAHYAQPIWFLILNAVMVYLLWIRPYQLKRSARNE